MSAICGIYHCDRRPVIPKVGVAMMRELGMYHADATGTWRKGEVFLGCHAQHITPESVGEVIPYHDDVSGLTITADAIIDNRVELCDKLNITHSQRAGMPDSLLILQSYLKWGQECSKYLVGDFAFAIWDEKTQKLFCAVDHTGTRAFYYYRSSGLFAFSTLIKPLFVLPEIVPEYNETWIADFLAIPSVQHQMNSELTLYRNIYMLPAGHTLTVRPDGVEKQVYWQVERQTELKLKSDGEYEEALRAILAKAVRCRMRSIRPVGVLMSGGLDSTSVACMAARELAKSGLRLQAFSAVPMLEYRDWLPVGRLADETSFIEEVRKYVGNIDVIYCRSEGKHPLSDTDRLLAILEQPYKIFENLFWIDDIMTTAQERNIGVILNGAAGNFTVSWGIFQPYLLSLFRTGQWRQVFRECLIYARQERYPLRALFRLFRNLLPYDIQKKLKRRKEYDQDTIWQELLMPINPEFACRTAVHKRFPWSKYDTAFVNQMDSFEIRKQMLCPEVFSHLGVISTKQSLAHRMAWRDPTMDKRVIEFCLSVPENQYVRDEMERSLLRRAMAGFLPDKVRLNETVKGRQSADWTQRLRTCWPKLATEIRNIGTLKVEQKYLNIGIIRRELTNFDVLNDAAPDNSGLCMLIRSLIFSRFLRQEGVSKKRSILSR